MQLAIDKCSHCNACVEACDKKANWECRHCDDPECVRACPKKAFRELMPDVWAVMPERCDGCELCALSCPYNAIYVDGYARKCDLCGGSPKCVQRCPCGLRLEETPEEIEETKRILGWEKAAGQYPTNAYFPNCQEARLASTVMQVFRELAKDNDAEIEETLDGYCEEAGIVLEAEQHSSLLRLLESELHGFSVLDALLADDSLEEITVSGIGEPIRVYKRGAGWLEADAAFNSPQKVTELINRMARPLGRRVTLQKPRLNASLPNGSRLHAAIPPVAETPCMTIRKFTKEPLSPAELVGNRTVSAEAMAFLSMAMQCDLNVIVAGSTGSGKTTTLNALSTFIPADERIIIVEETPEMAVPHEHCVRLTVNQELGLSMGELVNDTLRMRPDRVIVGEVRTSDEAKALVNTMLAGQGKGSLATFHALDSREAVNRLRALGISEHDLSALDLVVVQKRWDSYGNGERREYRRVTEISELDNAVPRKLFEYDAASDSLKRVGEGRVMKRMERTFRMDAKKLRAELAKRAGGYDR